MKPSNLLKAIISKGANLTQGRNSLNDKSERRESICFQPFTNEKVFYFAMK